MTSLNFTAAVTPLGGVSILFDLLSFCLAIYIFGFKIGNVTWVRLHSDFHFRLRFTTSFILILNRFSQLVSLILFFLQYALWAGDDGGVSVLLRRVEYFFLFAFFSSMYAIVVLLLSLSINRFERYKI